MCEFVCVYVCLCVFVCVFFCVPNCIFLIVCDVGTSTNTLALSLLQHHRK